MAPESRGALSSTPIAAALACLLGVILSAGPPLRSAAAAELRLWTGGDRPAFTLPDSAGANVALAAARGQVVLVHFFATWCEPCREELPALNRLTARAGGRVKVLAISVAEVDLRVRRFLDTMPVAFPVLLDRERITAKAWDVTTLPTTFVLDGDLHPRLVVETDYAWDGVDPGKLTDILAADAGGSATTANPHKSFNRGG